jgi:hypothetical protein
MRKPDRARPVVAPSLVALALAAVVLLALAACEQPTPEERVAKLRSEYTAELNSFNVREVPLTEEAVEQEIAEEVAEEALDEGGMGEPEVEVVEPVPVRQDVMLDIVVRKEGSTDRLEGLTLDVYQVEANEAEKANYRIYVDVSRLNPGSRKAVSYVLEDVDYRQGDGFAVEVRQPVPPEIRGEYKEFEEAMADGDGA